MLASRSQQVLLARVKVRETERERDRERDRERQRETERERERPHPGSPSVPVRLILIYIIVCVYSVSPAGQQGIPYLYSTRTIHRRATECPIEYTYKYWYIFTCKRKSYLSTEYIQLPYS